MRHAERGSSMVEFAIAALALLLFVFGILEFGRALYAYHTISNAARLGSRWAIVRGASCAAPLDHCQATSADVQTYTRTQIFALLDPSQLNVTANWPGGNGCAAGSNARGCPVTVTVSYQFGFILPFISATVPLSSTSQMTIAN